MRDDVYTSGDLQDMGFSRTKAFEILSDPTLPVIRIGRRKYVRVSDFEAWMNGKTIKTGSESEAVKDAITNNRK